MIRLNFFYPFSSFRRVTAEFHAEKALVKMKSLTFDQEFEFRYDEVAEILYESYISVSQMAFSLVVSGILSFAFTIFFPAIYESPLLLQVMRALYILSIVLVLFSFLQRRYYYFLDKNQKILMGMKVTARNYEAVAEAVELVARKSGNLRELDFDHPFPNSEPLFELTNYDIPNYFNKCQTRFYEKELVEFDKSMIGTNVISRKYDGLSREFDRYKKTSTSWDTLFQAVLVFLLIFAGFYRAFSVPTAVFLSGAAILIILLVVSLVLKYVKREIVVFHNKNGEVVYFIWISRSNKEKVEAIIQFIQSRIPVAVND